MKLGKTRLDPAGRSIPLTRPETGFSTIMEEGERGQRARRGLLAVNGVRLATPGVVRSHDGADPVLRPVAVLLGLAAQAVDQRAAAIEAVDARRSEAGEIHPLD